MLEASGAASGRSLPPSSLDAVWPRRQWWRDWRDPRLNALVEEALRNAPDIVSANARIVQARSTIQMVRANQLPQINGEAEGEVAKQSYNGGTPRAYLPQGWRDYGTLAVSASLDLDLWGKNKALLEAATSGTEAAVALAREAELALAANVVSSYFDLARLLARQQVLERALATREDTERLITQRVKQGLDREAPMGEAKAQVGQAREALEANVQDIAVRRHALAALLGAGPDRGLDIVPADIATIGETAVPADAGIALIGRRPDIAAARRLAEAEAGTVKYAQRSFLPDISLSGLLGLTSLGLGNLFMAGSDYGNAGAAISLPIFEGGRLEGQYRMTRASYDAAVANYNKTVLQALQDTADALARRNSAGEQERHARYVRDQTARGLSLATLRYGGGLSTYLDVLSVQQDDLAAQVAAVDAHFTTLASQVALTRALGGGYSDEASRKAPGHE